MTDFDFSSLTDTPPFLINPDIVDSIENAQRLLDASSKNKRKYISKDDSEYFNIADALKFINEQLERDRKERMDTAKEAEENARKEAKRFRLNLTISTIAAVFAIVAAIAAVAALALS